MIDSRADVKGFSAESRDSIAIRQVLAIDYEALTRFFEENNRSEVTKYFHPFPLTREVAFAIACTLHRDRYFIAIRRDRIDGMCMLRGWDEGFKIPSLGACVDYRYRGRGLGVFLTGFAIGEAKKMGCEKIRFSVCTRNLPTLRICLFFGCREIGRESVRVKGQLEERIILIKELNEAAAK